MAVILYDSRNYPYLPQGWLLEVLAERGVLIARVCKGKWNWKGSNEQTFLGRGMDIFWNYTFIALYT